MADQSTGYVRPYNWTNDALQGLDIDQGRMDDDGNQVAAALNNRLRLDGQGPTPTADIPMAAHALTGCRPGAAPGEPITFEQFTTNAQATAFAYCAALVF